MVENHRFCRIFQKSGFSTILPVFQKNRKNGGKPPKYGHFRCLPEHVNMRWTAPKMVIFGWKTTTFPVFLKNRKSGGKPPDLLVFWKNRQNGWFSTTFYGFFKKPPKRVVFHHFFSFLKTPEKWWFPTQKRVLFGQLFANFRQKWPILDGFSKYAKNWWFSTTFGGFLKKPSKWVVFRGGFITRFFKNHVILAFFELRKNPEVVPNVPFFSAFGVFFEIFLMIWTFLAPQAIFFVWYQLKFC